MRPKRLQYFRFQPRTLNHAAAASRGIASKRQPKGTISAWAVPQTANFSGAAAILEQTAEEQQEYNNPMLQATNRAIARRVSRVLRRFAQIERHNRPSRPKR